MVSMNGNANQITLKEILCYVIHQVDTMAVYIGHAQFNKFSELLNSQNLNDDIRNSILESFKEVTKYSPESVQRHKNIVKKSMDSKKEEGINVAKLQYERTGQTYYQQNKERLNKRKVELARLKREVVKQQQSPHEVNFNGTISV